MRHLLILAALSLSGLPMAPSEAQAFSVLSPSDAPPLAWVSGGLADPVAPYGRAPDAGRIPSGTGFQQSLEGRFGVAYVSGAEGSNVHPLGALRYSAAWHHELDTGWRVAVGFAIEARNFAPQASWADPAPWR